jgi:SAM-dependent methyltransferase
MEEFLRRIETSQIKKIVISNQKDSNADYKKVCILAKEKGYQIERYSQKQVFHENVNAIDVAECCMQYIEQGYRQIDLFTNDTQYVIKVSKKGKMLFGQNQLSTVVNHSTEHNRKKNYLIEEGQIIEPLVDMGIFTREGKIVRTMYDKFKQINRFLEIIDDSVSKQKLEHYHIIDFGCGKSYLTFIVYYYFTYVKKIPVTIIGLDLKADVIQKCNEAAHRYGYENLLFELGDINGYKTSREVDMVLTLHACDTATDYALYNAIQWKAKMIFSVPCCQHELNQQMKSDTFSLMTRYGIIQERFAALTTDAIRANLLEYSGYRTQLLEFVDLSHTPKNILIRAVKKSSASQGSELQNDELLKCMDFLGVSPSLLNLLKDEN